MVPDLPRHLGQWRNFLDLLWNRNSSRGCRTLAETLSSYLQKWWAKTSSVTYFLVTHQRNKQQIVFYHIITRGYLTKLERAKPFFYYKWRPRFCLPSFRNSPDDIKTLKLEHSMESCNKDSEMLLNKKLKKHLFGVNCNAFHSQFILGEQGWRSGESTRLPPMWPGFDSRSRPYVGCWLVLFSAPRGFSPGTPVFRPSPQKPTLSKFQFDPDTVNDKSHHVDVHC